MPPDRFFVALALVLGLALFLAAPALIALGRKHPDRKLICQLTPLTIVSFIL